MPWWFCICVQLRSQQRLRSGRLLPPNVAGGCAAPHLKLCRVSRASSETPSYQPVKRHAWPLEINQPVRTDSKGNEGSLLHSIDLTAGTWKSAGIHEWIVASTDWCLLRLPPFQCQGMTCWAHQSSLPPSFDQMCAESLPIACQTQHVPWVVLQVPTHFANTLLRILIVFTSESSNAMLSLSFVQILWSPKGQQINARVWSHLYIKRRAAVELQGKDPSRLEHC